MALEFVISIDELAITMYTNIPDKNLKKIKFQKSMLHFSEENEDKENSTLLNDLPYFTGDIAYPHGDLEKMTYMERIEFFFNKDTFTKTLEPYYQKQISNITKSNEIASQNIISTILLIFPTRFPVINNVHLSINKIKQIDSAIPFQFNPFGTFYFSHLNLQGKTYTFKKLTWLNDIINNPVYQEILIEYNRFVPKLNAIVIEREEKINKTLEEIKIVAKEIIVTLLEEKIVTKEKQQGRAAPMVEKNKITYNFLKENILLNSDTFKDDNKMLENITNIDTESINLSKDIYNSWNSLSENSYTGLKGNYYETNWQIINKINPSDKTKKTIKEKIQNLRKLFDTLGENIDNLKNLTKVFQEKFDNNSIQGLPKEFQDDYRNFNYTTLNKFRRPIRASSNFFLQEVLDPKENQDVIEFYDFLKHAYTSFIENKVFNTETIEKIDIGVITVNPGIKGQSKKEVSLMCEFIEGELNAGNMLKLYCPIYDDILGNKFPNLVDDLTSNNESAFWRVDYSEPMFSIDSNESQKASDEQFKSIDLAVKKEQMNKELPPNMDISLKNKNLSQNAVSKFQTNVVMPNKILIEEKLNNIKKIKPTFVVMANTLHTFLQEKDTTLVPLINDFTSKTSKTKNLLLSLNSKVGEYNASISNRELLIKENKYVSETEKAQHESETAILKLMIQVLEIMVKLEQNKPEATLTGGTKNKTKKKVRFNINKYNKTVKK